MKIDGPKVSVIVPVYNVLGYLERCIESVLNQTLSDMEIIIVDDGSTDGSGEWLDEHCGDDRRTTLIHKANGGLMSAWVEGVKESTGEYIGFVDSDDWIEPDMFRTLLESALEHDADIVTCNFYYDGHVKTQPIEYGLHTGLRMGDIRLMSLPGPAHAGLSMARWNKLFKRRVIEENLKYCESFSRTFEDRYIVPAALCTAGSLYYEKKALYHNTNRPGSNSGQYKSNLMEEIDRYYQVHHQMLADKGLLSELGVTWEMEYLDCIRNFVRRNIVGARGLTGKARCSRELIGNPIARDRMERYGDLMDGKQGYVLRFAFKHQAPIALALASCLA